MKQFEHEVLNFNYTNKKGYLEMSTALKEWGAAGFEVVSVVPNGQLGGQVTVFLKREITENESSEAAQL